MIKCKYCGERLKNNYCKDCGATFEDWSNGKRFGLF